MESPKEQIMLERLCAEVKSFYQDPKNIEAFEAWQKERTNNESVYHDFPRADGS